METAQASKNAFLEAFGKAKSKQLNELRKENEFCDLTLKCEDGFEIKVHRVVVSSASNYFKNLLTLPMKEKFEECISMPDITGDVLEKIITFIYTNEFEEKIEDVEKIIKYAAVFQLEELVEICSLTLSESINADTCVKYWRFAKNNLINSLVDKCLSYIASKVDHLFESSLMNDLSIEEMQSLLTDIKTHLQCDEGEIFEHCWKWAEGLVSEDKSFAEVFSEVVDLLDFSELENEFVFHKMFGYKNALANAELLNKVSELTKPKFKDDIASRHIFHKFTERKLLGLLLNEMIIGLGEESTIEKLVKLRFGFVYTENSNSCEFFEPSTEKWKKFPLTKKIDACGGFDSKTVEIFDLGKGKGIFAPKMLANNSSFGLTGVNIALYAIGGDSQMVEILDPRQQKYSLVCNDSRLHGYVRCVSFGPCIYCFTGGKRYTFDTRLNNFTEEISCKDFTRSCNICERDSYIYGLGYQKDPADKYSLNLIQYHPDGRQGSKKSYGLYNTDQDKLITKYNYPAEKTFLTTEDGYILGMHRIPRPGRVLTISSSSCYSGYLCKYHNGTIITIRIFFMVPRIRCLARK